MVAISIRYTGELHCEAIHKPSGTTISTDAPKDNQGKGESFSPTDLVTTALGSCVLTVMGILARKLDIRIDGASASVEKTMAPPPRRIASLIVNVTMPPGIPEEHRAALENAAHHCPVHKSLHPDIDAPIYFTWL